MLEVLPKKQFLGYKWGHFTLETKWYARNILTTKTRFVVLEPRSMDCSVHALKELKKYTMWELHPNQPPPYTPAYLNFGTWGFVLDLINHANFQLYRFTGLWAPGGRKSLSPIEWRYRRCNSVNTSVLHYGRSWCHVCKPVQQLTWQLLAKIWAWKASSTCTGRPSLDEQYKYLFWDLLFWPTCFCTPMEHFHIHRKTFIIIIQVKVQVKCTYGWLQCGMVFIHRYSCT